MSRGIQRERELVNRLRAEGWWAMRSPASKGCVDVVAIKAGQRTRFIEVKSTEAGPFHSFGPHDRAELLAEANRAGSVAELCFWPKRCEPQFLSPADWPNSK